MPYADQYRWTYHRDDSDDWCRWSLCSTTADPAGDDTRCPAGCAASTIEPVNPHQSATHTPTDHPRSTDPAALRRNVLIRAADTNHEVRGSDVPAETLRDLIRYRRLSPLPGRPGWYKATLLCGCQPGTIIAGQHRYSCAVTQNYTALSEALCGVTDALTESHETIDNLTALLPPDATEHLAEHRDALDAASTALDAIRDHAAAMTNPTTAPQ